MRIWKSHFLLNLVNRYLEDSPQPSNISYLWNLCSLLAFFLIIQIVTGVILAIYYNPGISEAFNSIVHLFSDVSNGWLVHYLHSNIVSAFFFIVYLHTGRGLYHNIDKYYNVLLLTMEFITLIYITFIAFESDIMLLPLLLFGAIYLIIMLAVIF